MPRTDVRDSLESSDRRAVGATVAVSGVLLVVALGGGIILSRGLGSTGRGQLAALLLWATIAMDVAMVGSGGSTAFHIARYPNHRAEIVRLATYALVPMALVAAVLFGLLMVSGADLEEIGLQFFLMFAAYASLRIAYEQVLAIAQGDREFGRFNAVRSIGVAAPVLIFGLLWIAGLLTALSAGMAYVAGLVIAVAFAFLASRPARRGQVSRGNDAEVGASYWNFALRNWASVLAAKANRSVDLFLLSMVVTAAEVGLYVVATGAATVVAIVGTATGYVAFPRLARTQTSGERSRVFWQLFAVAFTGTVAVALLIFAFADWVIPALYGSEFALSSGVARTLVVGYVAVSMATFTAGVLKGLDRPGAVALSQIAGFVVTIGLLSLVGLESIATVAVAASVGFWVTFLVEIVVSARELRRDSRDFKVTI